MLQTFRIDGMHCGGCVARVSRALKPLADSVEVTLDPPQAQLDVPSVLAPEVVQAAIAAVGDYTITPA